MPTSSAQFWIAPLTFSGPDNEESASPLDDLLQGPDHPLRRQREVDLHTQSLSVLVIDDVQQTGGPTVRQLVMHRVHGPDLVDLFEYSQRFWLFSV
jgi:hypothetical protein